MWRKNIIFENRIEATKNLRKKLFHTDSVFGQILLQHRGACKDLEQLRLLDLNQFNHESYTVIDFQ